MQSPSLDQLGDEITEMSAHLEAATTRLFDFISECCRRPSREEHRLPLLRRDVLHPLALAR